jgi:hypothetical protein
MKPILYFIFLTLLGCSQKNSEQDTDRIPHQIFSYEFDGNYFLTKPISVKDRLLESIQVSTRDSLNGFVIKGVYLSFSNKKDDEYYRVKTSFSGTKDNFLISANDSTLGNLEIKGQFFGEKGPMYDNIEGSKTIVFEGMFSCDGKNNLQFKCTYFVGD